MFKNMKRLIQSLLNKLCFLLLLVSAVSTIFLISKVIKVRSECVREQSRISALVKEIESYRDENKRLKIDFYSSVKPKLVDNETAEMKLLHENEVKYLK